MATFTIFNNIKRIARSVRLETESIATIFGNVKLDLTRAPLEPGDHTMRVLTIFGNVKLRLPEQLGLKVNAISLFSDVDIETVSDSTEENPGGNWVSENFDQAPVRIHLSLLGLFGDIDIVRLPTSHVHHAVHHPDSDALIVDRMPAYEGQTSKLNSNER